MARSDTSPAAADVQRDVLHRMGPDRRVRLAFEMGDEIRTITLEGLHGRLPEADDSALTMALIEIWHGGDVTRAVAADHHGD